MTDKFYSYDPDEGFTTWGTAEEAEGDAERVLTEYASAAQDAWEWPADVGGVHWGRLLPLGIVTGTEGTDDYGELWTDYHLAAQPDELAQLRARVATLTAERDKAQANYAYVVERAADQRLDGYRELGARAAAAENERDALRARVAKLDAHELAVAEAVGIVYEAYGHAPAPGPCNQVVAEIKRLRTEARDAYELRQRLAELEAPPVVPEGWEVSSRHGSWGLLDRHGYAVDADEAGILHTSIDDYIPWSAVRALAWAIETDSRPPHESDSHGK